MASSRRAARSDPKAGWVTLLAIAGLAVAFGIFVLPRLSPGPEGKPAPDFALPVMHGGERDGRVRLSEQRGKLVLLDFWASWCRPCQAQMAVLEKVRARYADRGLVVLGINVSDSRPNALQYLARVKPSWVVLEDSEGTADLAYDVEALPTLVAIDREGNVVAIRRRFVAERELAALIETML